MNVTTPKQVWTANNAKSLLFEGHVEKADSRKQTEDQFVHKFNLPAAALRLTANKPQSHFVHDLSMRAYDGKKSWTG